MQIGVVIPALNAGRFIGDALGSLRRQTHPAWQAVVVDDGSTDDTAALAAASGDPRVRVLRQDHAGVSAARNHGAAALAGDALLFLDADDWLAPDALARLSVTLAGQPAAIAAYGSYAFVAQEAGPGGSELLRRSGPFPSGDLFERLVVRNIFTSGGPLLIRRHAFESAGGFTPGLVFGEDWECWVRLSLQGPFAVVPGGAPLLYVRRPSSGTFRRLGHLPCSFEPANRLVFGNPAVIARLGPRLATLRAHTEIEQAWVIGRELVRVGRVGEGRAALRRAFRGAPSLRRAMLLGAVHVAPGLLPQFRRYRE